MEHSHEDNQRLINTVISTADVTTDESWSGLLSIYRLNHKDTLRESMGTAHLADIKLISLRLYPNHTLDALYIRF